MVRIFVSSPGDVSAERSVTKAIIARLAHRYRSSFEIEAVFWEDEPLLATDHFQEQIIKPSDSDIVVVILWWRLGTLLPPENFASPISGEAVTGTQWEFEEAFKSYRERGKPSLLVYRKLGQPEFSAGASGSETLKNAQAVAEQQEAVAGFIKTWLVDENIKRAFWQFETDQEFENLLTTHLTGLLDKYLHVEKGAARWPTGSPYVGLNAYDLDHASVFFGRTRARNELRKLLSERAQRSNAFVLVLGSSGSGKSSLVRAGLLADLTIPGMVEGVAVWRYAIVQPSMCFKDLVLGLAQVLLSDSAIPELADIGYPEARLAAVLSQSGISGDDAADSILEPVFDQALNRAREKDRNLSENAQVRMLLILDQLEEVFTIEEIEPEDRERFFKIISHLSRTGRVWVVATMRSDFYDRLEQSPTLSELSAGEGRYLVLPPNDAEINQIVAGPAREAGLTFEIDPESGIPLDQTIRMAAKGELSALPLLSFAMDELWHHGHEDGLLSIQEYEEIGGFEGAIGNRAEAVFKKLPAEVQREFPALVRSLVTVGSNAASPAAARTAQMDELKEGSAAAQLVDSLVAARLVVVSGERDHKTIRIAHEALLRHWPRVKTQIHNDIRDLLLRDRLEQSLALWQEKREGRALVGLALVEAEDLVARRGAELKTNLVGFVTSSRAERRRRVARNVSVSAVPTLIVLTLLLYVFQLEKSELLEVKASVSAWVTKFAVAVSGPMEPVMVRIEPTDHEFDFQMGSSFPGAKPDELPPVRIKFPGAFHLSTTEVTYQQYDQFAQATDRPLPVRAPEGLESNDRYPVAHVSWEDARDYAQWLRDETDVPYRLPTEAEWEYVARAGSTSKYPWGDLEENASNFANCMDCGDLSTRGRGSLPVDMNKEGGTRELQPNRLGLYDMQGNVAEWVQDCWSDDLTQQNLQGAALVIPGCRRHVHRGGSWQVPARELYSSNRGSYDGKDLGIGFRLAADEE